MNRSSIATGRRRVPVAFGWHLYLRVPGGARGRWRLRLPARTRLLLDDFGIPTGASARETAEAEPIGRRTLDDLCALGRGHRLALEADGSAIDVRCGANYPFAQVWVPPGQSFAALEPMTAPTNVLGNPSCRSGSRSPPGSRSRSPAGDLEGQIWPRTSPLGYSTVCTLM